MRKRTAAFALALAALMLLAGCAASEDTAAAEGSPAVSEGGGSEITSFSDCADWTSAEWDGATDETQKAAALAFIVEYSGSTEETFQKLADRAAQNDELGHQQDEMRKVIAAWYDQADSGSTLTDLLALTQEAAASVQTEGREE